MNRPTAAQTVAACLSVLITMCTVLALNALAASEHTNAQAQQLAAGASTRA